MLLMFEFKMPEAILLILHKVYVIYEQLIHVFITIEHLVL